MELPFDACAITRYKPPPGSTNGLSLSKDQIVKVLSYADDDGDYYHGETEDKSQGIFPAHVVQKINTAPIQSVEETAQAEKSESQDQGTDARERSSPATEDTQTDTPPLVQETHSSSSVKDKTPTESSMSSTAKAPSEKRPPPPTKSSAFKDRLAAFNTVSSAQSAPSLLPKSKPPPIARKPIQVTEKAEPQAHDPSRDARGKGMSAEDAQESISKGGSLKDRIAALQGLTIDTPSQSSRPLKPWRKKEQPVEQSAEDIQDKDSASAEEGKKDVDTVENKEKGSSVEESEKVINAEENNENSKVASSPADSRPSLEETTQTEKESPVSQLKAEIQEDFQLSSPPQNVVMPAIPKRAAGPRRKGGRDKAISETLPSGTTDSVKDQTVTHSDASDEKVSVPDHADIENTIIESNEAGKGDTNVRKENSSTDLEESKPERSLDPVEYVDTVSAEVESQSVEDHNLVTEETNNQNIDSLDSVPDSKRDEDITGGTILEEDIADQQNDASAHLVKSLDDEKKGDQQLESTHNTVSDHPQEMLSSKESISETDEHIDNASDTLHYDENANDSVSAQQSEHIDQDIEPSPENQRRDSLNMPEESRIDEKLLAHATEYKSTSSKHVPEETHMQTGIEMKSKQSEDIEASPEQKVKDEAEEEVDEEVERRRRMAKRIAAMGGVKIGMIPQGPSQINPKQRRASANDESQEIRDGVKEDTGVDKKGAEEEEEEEDEEARLRRREAIARKIAAQGGVRIGMLPQMPPKRQKSVETRKELPEETESTDSVEHHPAPPPPVTNKDEIPASRTSEDGICRSAPPVPRKSGDSTATSAPPVPRTSVDSMSRSPPRPNIPAPPVPRTSVDSISKSPPLPNIPAPPVPSSAFIDSKSQEDDELELEDEDTGEDTTQERIQPPPPMAVPPPPPPVTHEHNLTDVQVDKGQETYIPERRLSRTLPTSPPPPPPHANRLSSSSSSMPSNAQLLEYSSRLGAQIFARARSRAKDGSSKYPQDGGHAFVQSVFAEVPDARVPESGKVDSFGWLVFEGEGEKERGVRLLQGSESEIKVGDICVIQNGKFKSKGLAASNTSRGSEEAFVGIVSDDYDIKKHKIRIYEVSKGKVCEEGYHLDHLRSGRVAVYRAMPQV